MRITTYRIRSLTKHNTRTQPPPQKQAHQRSTFSTEQSSPKKKGVNHTFANGTWPRVCCGSAALAVAETADSVTVEEAGWYSGLMG
jgi:hypothetical protein